MLACPSPILGSCPGGPPCLACPSPSPPVQAFVSLSPCLLVFPAGPFLSHLSQNPPSSVFPQPQELLWFMLQRSRSCRFPF